MTEIARQTKYNPVSAETRDEIIKDALGRIETETLHDIATSHGISKQALNAWLTALGPEYQEQRERIIDAKLASAEAELERAGKKEQEEGNIPSGQLSLARAREILRSAQWLAERRDSRYSNKGGVTVQVGVAVGLTGSASDLLKEYLPE
jgi:hypothetical protein